jgi:DNA-binding cell septation regulator SpoVG
MKPTKVTCFPVNSTGKVKANGTVTLEDSIELKYALMQGPKDIFISWNGGKAYKKKDGSNGWDSPIYIKDEALNKTITEQVMAKYKSLGSKTSSPAPSAESNDSSFGADDIPF